MTDYKKLCEELRDDKFKYDEGYPSYSSFKTTRDCADTADAIEELQSASEEKDRRIVELQVENERLKKQVDEYKKYDGLLFSHGCFCGEDKKGR